ncbi:MAG TPA: hypothetical protein VF834_08580 [Streptosporangiaceae bacterium]
MTDQDDLAGSAGDQPRDRRWSWHPIATAVLAAAVLALSGLLVLSLSASGTQRQALARQERQIAALRGRMSAAGRALSAMSKEIGSVRQETAAASRAHLGFCEVQNDTLTDSYGDTISGVLAPWDLSTPVIKGGVVSCPSGQFVTVVPSPHGG